MWIARDKDKVLRLFLDKPKRFDVNWSAREIGTLSNEGYFSEDSVVDLINSFSYLTWEDEPEEVIMDSKEDLIKRFEILNTMYKNTNPDSINHCSFKEYALKNWDNIDINYFNKIS